jgi:hypothetical protein
MFPTKKQLAGWSLPSKYTFWGAVIGIPLAMISLIIQFIIPLFQKDNHAAIRSQLIFKVAHEFLLNRTYLSALAQLVRKDNGTLPIGRVNADALLLLMEQHYDLVTKDAYGEQKYLYPLSLELKSLGGFLAGITSFYQLKAFHESSAWSVDDVLFLNDFLHWYLRSFITKYPSTPQLHYLGFYDSPGCFWGFPAESFRIEGVEHPVLRKFLDGDGASIQEFSLYLGLID